MSSLHPASPSLWVLIWVSAFLDSVGAAEVKAGAGGEEEEGGGGQSGPGSEVSGKSGALISLREHVSCGGRGRYSRTAWVLWSLAWGLLALLRGPSGHVGPALPPSPCPCAPAPRVSLQALNGAVLSCPCLTHPHQSLLA